MFNPLQLSIQPVCRAAYWALIVLYAFLCVGIGNTLEAAQEPPKSSSVGNQKAAAEPPDKDSDWTKAVVEGLSSADLAEAIRTILQQSVANGPEHVERQLIECLRRCVERNGTSHLRAKSVQLGLDYVRKLMTLDAKLLHRLQEAANQSAQAHNLLLKGQATASLEFLNKALSTQKEIHQTPSITIALNHAKLAVAQTILTEFNAANHNFRLANQFWQETAFEIHPFNSVLVSNQAAVATKLGLDQVRIKLLARAQNIAMETSGKNSIDYLYPTVGLAAYYVDMGMFDKAFPLIDSLEAGMSALAESEAVLTMLFLQLQTTRYSVEKENEKRDAAISKLINYANKHTRNNRPESIRALSSIALVLIFQGMTEKAIEVLNLIESQKPEQQPHNIQLGDSFGRLGILSFHVGNHEKAYWYLQKAVKITLNFMEGEQFGALTQREQRNFKLGTAWLFNNYFHFALTVKADAEELSDVALKWKGSVFVNSRNTQRQMITTKELTGAIPPDSLFVNIVEFSKFSPTASGLSYRQHDDTLLAIILEPRKEPRYCELCHSGDVRTLVEKWRVGTTNSSASMQEQIEAREAAVQLKKLVWDPLKLKLPNESLVMFSPDSALGNFCIGALPSETQDRYLIEDYRFLNVAVPRLVLANREPATRELLAFGNIDFGGLANTATTAVKQADGEQDILRGGNGELAELTYSKTEIDSVAKLFPSDSKNVFEKKAATEQAFRNLATSSRLLLISSHAFCNWRSTPKPGISKTASISQRLMNNLDLKSGLAFSRANAALEMHKSTFIEPKNFRDGILYSSEIESLDLNCVDLAVLSACSSGDGAPTGGEGVISLSRSFQIAGVKSTVATLWNVNDQATSKIVVKFFEYMMHDQLPAVDAIRKAQLWAINNPKQVVGIDAPRVNLAAKHQSKKLSPYYWAPFSISGNIPSNTQIPKN